MFLVSKTNTSQPNEVFLAALAALTSVQASLHRKLTSDQHDGARSVAAELETTVLPLLEILRRVLPHAAHVENNGGALLGE